MKLIIGGDLAIEDEVASAIEVGAGLHSSFASVDYRILNLECPCPTSKLDGIEKTGPVLIGGPANWKILEELGIDLVTMANNHCLDLGERGLIETMNGCCERGIDYLGAGQDLASAGSAKVIENDGIKLGLLNFGENEWASASRLNGGSNPYGVVRCARAVRELSTECDVTILIIHGGHEHYELPSPRMVDEFRFFVEEGADVVVCHHSHRLSGYEIYKNRPIFYGLGNFCFPRRVSDQKWFQGQLINLEISGVGDIKWSLEFVGLDKKGWNLELLNGTDEWQKVRELSRIIKSNQELGKNWEAFVDHKKWEYSTVYRLASFLPGRIPRAVMRRMGLDFITQARASMLRLLNLVRCEAHLDVMRDVLRSSLKLK